MVLDHRGVVEVEVSLNRQRRVLGEIEIGAFDGHVARAGGADIEIALDGDGAGIGLDGKVVGEVAHKINGKTRTSSQRGCQCNRTAADIVDHGTIRGNHSRIADKCAPVDTYCFADEEIPASSRYRRPRFNFHLCLCRRRTNGNGVGSQFAGSIDFRPIELAGNGRLRRDSAEDAVDADNRTVVEEESARIEQIYVCRTFNSSVDMRLAAADGVVKGTVVELGRLADLDIELDPVDNTDTTCGIKHAGRCIT